MGVEQGLLALVGAADVDGAYEIEQSLRFNSADSNYMERTFSSAGNRQTWTYSCWFKHGKHSQQQTLWSAGGSFGVYDYINFSSNSGTYKDFLEHYIYAISNYYRTSSVYRDDSAWYHVVIVWDTTNATAADRLRQYINGVRIDAYSVSPTISQNTNSSYINTASKHRFGLRADSNTSYTGQLMDGYMAEVHFIDGTAVDPDGNLGEFDDNGVWRPIKYTGSYGSNGVYLKFDPTATNGIGHDHSGNGNNFTATNFTTSGTGTDVMSDTPTTNWCTLNPLNTGAAYTLSNGNLEFTSSTNWDGTTGTFAVSSGKWYYEFTRGSGTSGLLGWCEPQNYDITTEPGDPANSSVWRYRDDGTKRNGETGGQSYGATWTTAGDVIGCALDLDAGTIAFYKNGTSQGTAYSNLSGKTLVPVIGFYNCTAASSVNFGQRAFAYTPPTGFKALNTKNLPAPDIADGTQYFNTVLYDGNSTDDHAITGVGFSPDLVWIKPRDNADHHRLNTTTQGANRTLSSNLQSAEYGPANAYLDSFDADGFTVSGSDNGWNNSSHDYVAWNWKEGAVPGFEIVTYTGNGYPTTNTQNISHSLGVAPSFITIKNRDRSSQWLHYVKPLGATKGMEGWHDGDTAYTNSNYFADTEPTDTQFTVGKDSGGNWQGDDFIAYLWAEVDGFFKVGTYERNGSTDGPFIYLGFTPALIIIKEYAAGTEGWPIYDNKRLGYNPNDTPMFINATTTETYIQSTYPNEIDFLSNGFKIRNNDSRQNSSLSSYRYLYWAWAVHPFGGSGVSPATAR